MGTMNNLTIVKLGGSLITHKDTPLKVDELALDKVAKEIARSLRMDEVTKLILIHGGGSFGHFFASKYHITVTPRSIPSHNAAKTAASMMTLHSIALNRFVAAGIPCKSLLTSEFISDDNQVTVEGGRYLRRLLDNNLVPITFGNLAITKRGSKIVSGDQIALALTKIFRVKKVIFAMDVDGIYQRPDLNGEIFKELNKSSEFHGGLRRYDVTGGITSKIKIGMQIAKGGTDVFYVNGKKSGRLQSLISNRITVRSTRIPAMRISI